MRDHYSLKGYQVELEYSVSNRRADVFVKGINVAFEVEFSSKEAGYFLRKCLDYEMAQTRSLWILRQNANYASIEVGKRVMITTSPVLDAYLLMKRKGPQKLIGPRIAFFSYARGVPVVIRGELSAHMLYREEFGNYGGYEYPSRRKMILCVEEIIRKTDETPRFPGANAQRASIVYDVSEAA